jgi:hypothetical protein
LIKLNKIKGGWVKKTKKRIVYLRGHHLFVLEKVVKIGEKHFVSRHSDFGYGKRFIKNALTIFRKIISSKIRVKIVNKLDDVCQSCKWQSSRNCSDSEAETQDEIAAKFFGLEVGEIYSSSTIIKKLKG